MPDAASIIQPASREQLLAGGAVSLSDAELVALFIGTGRAGQNCLQLAHALLHKAGSLRALLLLKEPSALRLQGFGPARYAALQSALELARRAQQGLGAAPLEGDAAVRRHLIRLLTDLPVQSFAAAFLRANGECLSCERLFNGTLRFVQVHARELVRRALSLNAAAVSVARSDPESLPLALASDHALHAHLSSALAIVGVELRDFLVVGQSGESLSIDPKASLTGDAPWMSSKSAPAPQQLALDLTFHAAQPSAHDPSLIGTSRGATSPVRSRNRTRFRPRYAPPPRPGAHFH